ncbi:MAG: leucine-rich repeat domain-containing protein [bacterium]
MKTVTFLTSILLAGAPFAKAELDLGWGNNQRSDQTINMSMTPSQPEPDQDVQVELGSAKVNINVSHITWYVDRSKTKEGLGVKELSLKSKGLGKPTLIKAVVVAKDGSKFEISSVIVPKRLSIRIEPVPNCSNRLVKVIAVAEVIDPLTGKLMLDEDLFYKWSFNNTVAGALCGLGKDSIVLKRGSFVDKLIEVVVRNAKGETIFETSRIFKEKHIQSLFDQATNTNNNSSETGISAKNGNITTLPEKVFQGGAFLYSSNHSTITIIKYTGHSGEVTVPSVINNKPVTGIKTWAFRGCTSISSVTIPKTVVNIGSYVFEGCTKLTSIMVEEANVSYSTIDGALFNKTKTELIQVPIGKSGNYIIPNGVTSIGNNSFESCTKLQNIVIPASVTFVGKHAFAYCKDVNVCFTGDVPNLGEEVFFCAETTPVYYLPGKKGWSSWKGGRQAKELTP